MQKESALKLVVVGVAACAAVFGLSAFAPADDTRFFAAITAEQQIYMDFIANYGRNFGTSEELQFRLKTFCSNKKKIDDHNAKNETSTVDLNQFSDLTPEEFKKMLGSKEDNNNATGSVVPTFLEPTGLAPSTDWRTQGAVTSVKN